MYCVQKQIAVVVDGPVARKEAGAVRKVAVQKKVTLNPKPEVIIEISSEKEEEKSESRKQSRGSSSKKKKVYSLTSILTARSKVYFCFHCIDTKIFCNSYWGYFA